MALPQTLFFILQFGFVSYTISIISRKSEKGEGYFARAVSSSATRPSIRAAQVESATVAIYAKVVPQLEALTYDVRPTGESSRTEDGEGPSKR